LASFNDLSKNNNHGLVAYDKLQERLITTGKLDAGASVLMIEHTEKNWKTGDYNVYKIGRLAATREGERNMR
jgi:hypothetical protein